MSTAPVGNGNPTGNGNALAAIGLVFLAIVFAALAVFYLTQDTSFLASEFGRHTKHAILFIVLAGASVVAANFVRPKA